MKEKFKKHKLLICILVAIALLAVIIFAIPKKYDTLKWLGVIMVVASLIIAKVRNRYDIFKIVSLVILATGLLTWVIPVGQFTGSDMYVGELSRLGIANLFITGVYSLSTVLNEIVFLLVLGGFYAVLSSINAYKNLVGSVAKKCEGKEIVFILITSLLFAGLASITSQIYPLLVFVPFVISIILNMKLDKITAFCTSFGSILVGTLGATYSSYVYGYINSYFGVDFNAEIITKVAIFVLTFVLFNFFNILHVKSIRNNKKSKNNKEVMAEEDRFSVVVEDKKAKSSKTPVWPLVTILVFVLAFLVLGYIGWTDSFNINVFTKFHDWLLGIKVGGHPIFQYILGASDLGVVTAFGTWQLFNMAIVLIVISLIIALAYGVSLNDLISKYIEGAKKMSRICLIVVLVNVCFVIMNIYPVMPTVMDAIMSLTKHFNIYLASLASLITSIFNVNLGFTAYTVGPYFASMAGKYTALSAIISNSMYGFAGFFAPTSAMLMIGLAYLNIPYKSWMKYIWRFLLGLLVGLMIIFSIVRYM